MYLRDSNDALYPTYWEKKSFMTTTHTRWQLQAPCAICYK